MKKKLLSILLALTMLATLLTACGSNGSSAASAASSGSGDAQTAAEAPKEVSAAETPAAEAPASTAEESTQESVFEVPEVSYPLTDTPESFSLWYSFPGDLSDIMDAYLTGGQSSVLKAVAEKTGVSLTFMLQSVTTASDNFNLLVASGDYPDLFYNASSYYTGGIDKAVEDEVLVDVTELVPEYAPNYYYNITKDPDTLSEVSTPAGRLVEIQRLEAEYTKSSTGLVIRQDWLDDLGKDMPVTLDDLHDVLTAFKNEKGATEALGIPYTGVLDEDEICSAFDVGGVYAAFMGAYPVYVVDGDVKFGWVEEGFKDYLTLMHQWYTEGLLGADFYIENTGHGLDASKTTTGQSGVFTCDYFQMDLLQSQMAEEGADIQAMAAPVMEAGQTLHFASKKTLVGDNSWSITTACHDAPLALQYMDYFFTDEGSILCNYGVEGEGMEYGANGEPEYTELVYNNPDHSMRETQVMYTLTIGPFIEKESRSDIAYSEKEIEARSTWDSNTDDAYTMPTTEMSADQASEMAGIMGDLMTYATGKVTEFIIGSDDLANWDAYLQQMETLNIDRVVEIYQEVYDAYAA